MAMTVKSILNMSVNNIFPSAKGFQELSSLIHNYQLQTRVCITWPQYIWKDNFKDTFTSIS